MTRIIGVDFSSAPRRAKPIVIARGICDESAFRLDGFELVESLARFEEVLSDEASFVGGFDFPFGLPREFVDSYDDIPNDWLGSIEWMSTTPKDAIVERFRAFMEPRPVGSKFAHRVTDLLATSSSSMRWVNPPVAFMLREGVPRLVAAGCDIPGLRVGDSNRVALEAYPGVVARAITRASYKADEAAKQTIERRDRRVEIIRALERGKPLGVALIAGAALVERIVDDARGDTLDAVICAMQATYASRLPRYGMPEAVDPIEGFICGVPEPKPSLKPSPTS